MKRFLLVIISLVMPCLAMETTQYSIQNTTEYFFPVNENILEPQKSRILVAGHRSTNIGNSSIMMVKGAYLVAYKQSEPFVYNTLTSQFEKHDRQTHGKCYWYPVNKCVKKKHYLINAAELGKEAVEFTAFPVCMVDKDQAEFFKFLGQVVPQAHVVRHQPSVQPGPVMHGDIVEPTNYPQPERSEVIVQPVILSSTPKPELSLEDDCGLNLMTTIKVASQQPENKTQELTLNSMQDDNSTKIQPQLSPTQTQTAYFRQFIAPFVVTAAVIAFGIPMVRLKLIEMRKNNAREKVAAISA